MIVLVARARVFLTGDHGSGNGLYICSQLPPAPPRLHLHPSALPQFLWVSGLGQPVWIYVHQKSD